MKSSLKPAHLKRYKDIVALFWKYGRSDIALDLGDDEVLDQQEKIDDGKRPKPDELADDLEKMGPTFVKIGQLLSSRADLLPGPYLDALARLQDKVKPFPYAEVENIVQTELGVRISKAFSRFDAEPLAAASLGQVHFAALRDGREVVVKVQRPGIRQQIVEDFDALAELAAFFDDHTTIGKRYRFRKIVDEFKNTLFQELDYEREADNLTKMSESLKEFPRVTVPLPVLDYSTRSVLTMDFVRGTKITKLSPLTRIDIDGESLADEVFRAYLRQVLVDGLFHADPHPGNVFLTDDGRIALLDLGMVGRLSPELQEHLTRLVLAISEARGPEAAQITIDMGEKKPDFDKVAFVEKTTELVGRFQGSTAADVEVGRIMLEVFRSAAENGIRLPVEMAMLGRALLALDQVGRTLDPEFDPNASIRRNASGLMQQRMLKSLSPGRMFANALELNELVQKLPGRLNRLLDHVSEDGVSIKVRVHEEVWLMEGMQKIANRLTTGLILAALIMGAALMMRVQTRFTIGGYPGIAMLFFLGAALIALWLMANILRADVHRAVKPPPGTK